MSAIVDSSDKNAPIRVLFALHKDFNALDYVGPMETFFHARHNMKDAATRAFELYTAAEGPAVKSEQGMTVKADMDFEDALDRIDEWDMLVAVGGGIEAVLKDAAGSDEPNDPIPLFKAFAELQEKDPSKERTLFSVCTGSLLLAKAGLLQGLAATTHPDYYTRLEILCSEAARNDLGERTDVMEERYVVNNARFDLGENLDENPFIITKRPAPGGRRKSIARKGSDAFKLSRRRESLVRRGQLPLGGLRLITSSGVTAGIDAALYLVAALVSHESALDVAKLMQFTWTKGVTVEGIDV